MQAIATAAGCPPEPDGKILLSHHRFDGRTWINQAGTELEASTLLASFHSARSCYVGCQRRTVNKGLSQLCTLHAIIPTFQARRGHHYSRSVTAVGVPSSFQIRFEACLLHRREFISGTISLVPKPMAGEDIGPSSKTQCCHLVNGHGMPVTWTSLCHRLVLLSALVREASFCSGRGLLQSAAENKSVEFSVLRGTSLPQSQAQGHCRRKG